MSIPKQQVVKTDWSYFTYVGLLSLLAQAIAWYALAWCFSLVAAGYMESLGRASDSSVYYNLLRNGIQLPPLIGIGYGVITYIILLPDLKILAANRELGPDSISKIETYRFRISGLLGTIIWALLGLYYAQKNAPDLWIHGLVFGAFVGVGAKYGVLSSLYLVRRKPRQLWIDAIILIAFAVVAWMSVSWILSALRSKINNS